MLVCCEAKETHSWNPILAALLREHGDRVTEVRDAQPLSFAMRSEGLADRVCSWEGETLVKPLYGNRSSGIKVCRSFDEAVERAEQRQDDVLVQQMI